MSNNLALVLQTLHASGPASRAEVARATGLTKATVSALVNELAGLGLVRADDEPVQGPTGRPATLVSVSGETCVAIGLEVNVDSLRVATVDLEGRVSHERRVELDPAHSSPEAVATRLASLVASVVHALTAEGRRSIGTGLAVPGLVSQPAGRVLVAPNLGWSEVPLTDLLTRRLGRRGIDAGPVRADNEANLAALAHRPGLRAQHVHSFLTISGGVGVGAGVVIDGAVFRGSHGFGGELGHVVVDPDGRPCRCGNRGCLETVVGEEHLLRLVGLRRSRQVPWLERLVARAEAGDREMIDALERVGRSLAVSLTAAVNLFDPEAIVLGGFFAALAPWLAPTITATLADHALGYRWAPIPVIASDLGRSAAVVGAAHQALTPLLADPALVAAARDLDRPA